MQVLNRFSSTMPVWLVVVTAVVTVAVVSSGCSSKKNSNDPAQSSQQTLGTAPLVDAKKELQKEVTQQQGAPAAQVAPAAPAAPAAQVQAPGAVGGVVAVPAGSAQPQAQAQPQVQTQAQLQVPVEVKPAIPEQECFSFMYRHKPTTGHSNELACSRHQNSIKLKHPKVNKDSLCVRVNGIPVKHQWAKGSSDEVIIANIAGPNAKIETRYCLGKVKCTDDCKVPRDEFLDAIGGGQDQGGQAQAGKWDSAGGDEHAKLDAQVKKEMADFEEKTVVFKDWQSDERSLAESAVCKKIVGSKQAKK